MKKFDWTLLKNPNNLIIIHCKNKKEYDNCLSNVHNAGNKLHKHLLFIRKFEDDTYVISNKMLDPDCTESPFSSFLYTKTEIEWSDYMNTDKTFTKDDLKTGMLITLRNGDSMVILKTFTDFDPVYKQLMIQRGIALDINNKYWRPLANFRDDLTHVRKNEYDIMKVCIPESPNSYLKYSENDNKTVLWTRDESYYYELRYFRSRKDNGSLYIKTDVNYKDCNDEDNFLETLLNKNQLSETDCDAIMQIKPISKETYNEMTI